MHNEETDEFYYWRANDSLLDKSYIQALEYLLAAFEINPEHVEVLTSIAEIYILYPGKLNMDASVSYGLALEYINRALDIEPDHADAWGVKGLLMLYTDQYEEALKAAERGFSALPLRIGYGMNDDTVYTNIEEALFDRKIRALIALDRNNEAKQTLSDGLRKYPDSKYLSRLIDDFLPDCSLGEAETSAEPEDNQ